MRRVWTASRVSRLVLLSSMLVLFAAGQADAQETRRRPTVALRVGVAAFVPLSPLATRSTSPTGEPGGRVELGGGLGWEARLVLSVSRGMAVGVEYMQADAEVREAQLGGRPGKIHRGSVLIEQTYEPVFPSFAPHVTASVGVVRYTGEGFDEPGRNPHSSLVGGVGLGASWRIGSAAAIQGEGTYSFQWFDFDEIDGTPRDFPGLLRHDLLFSVGLRWSVAL